MEAPELTEQEDELRAAMIRAVRDHCTTNPHSETDAAGIACFELARESVKAERQQITRILKLTNSRVKSTSSQDDKMLHIQQGIMLLCKHLGLEY